MQWTEAGHPQGWMAETASMRIGEPLDPALEAASLALNGRAEHPSSRFASIELRGQARQLSTLAPIGYALSVIAALLLVVILWTL